MLHPLLSLVLLRDSVRSHWPQDKKAKIRLRWNTGLKPLLNNNRDDMVILWPRWWLQPFADADRAGLSSKQFMVASMVRGACACSPHHPQVDLVLRHSCPTTRPLWPPPRLDSAPFPRQRGRFRFAPAEATERRPAIVLCRCGAPGLSSALSTGRSGSNEKRSRGRGLPVPTRELYRKAASRDAQSRALRTCRPHLSPTFPALSHAAPPRKAATIPRRCCFVRGRA